MEQPTSVEQSDLAALMRRIEAEFNEVRSTEHLIETSSATERRDDESFDQWDERMSLPEPENTFAREERESAFIDFWRENVSHDTAPSVLKMLSANGRTDILQLVSKLGLM